MKGQLIGAVIIGIGSLAASPARAADPSVFEPLEGKAARDEYLFKHALPSATTKKSLRRSKFHHNGGAGAVMFEMRP